MTRPAGRALDAEVAEKVMGIHVDKVLRSVNVRDLPKVNQEFQAIGIPACCVPNYSSSIADAWSVVERLKEQGCDVMVRWAAAHANPLKLHQETWLCWIATSENKGFGDKADTAPLAICLAALKVKA